MIEKAILYFSGGKDSTAMLYYLDDLIDRFDVIFCNTGAILPEIEDHIYWTCEKLGARIITIKPPMDLREFHKKQGLPSDIVPFETTIEYRDLMHGEVPQLIQSYGSCCYQMIMKPLDDYTREHSYNVALRGSKKCDARVGVPDGFEYKGVTYISPIWDWTHDEVARYLKDRSVQLPHHYDYFPDSLDCFLCTGHLKHYGLERIEFIKKFHPEKWPELFDNICKVDATITSEYNDFRYTIEEGIRHG